MLKKLKIAPKLILCFVIVVLITSISGFMGVYILLKTDTDYSNALINNGFSTGNIGTFNTYLNKGGAVVRDIVMLTSPADIKAAQEELAEISVKCDEAFALVKERCTTPEEQEYIATIDQSLADYRGLRDKVIELGLQNRNDEALNIFRNQARPVLNQAMTAAESLAVLNQDIGTQLSNDLTKGTQMTMFIMVAVIVLSMVFSVGIALFVARSIAKPIIAVQKAAGQLEQGDLNIHISSDASDEVGIMTRSFASAAKQIRAYIADIDRGLSSVAKGNFNVTPTEEFRGDFTAIRDSIATIIVSLSDTMGQIIQASDQVSAGSNQVSYGAQALSQGAAEQASSVEELAATINEISHQVQTTADNARQANALSEGARQEVDVCSKQMNEMNAAMNEISHASREIGKIIKTIEDIAFQTNILALNAAVEAARAGAAGKGFAVVADEVRNLASKSAEAAGNTKALIESAIHAVENGTKLATNTTSSLQQVVESTVSVSSTISKISSATEEQADSIAQVTTGVDQISAVVQTNSATAEESAAASEELSAQAEMLKALMAQFQLLESGSGVLSSITEAKPVQPRTTSKPTLTAGKY